jgi:RNA polymerase sigma factor (sigma-70 family)
MPPPPAEPFATRILLGPALRSQPDRRLVKLVREGYESAFEEIVRRYRRPLDRFAAAIVGGRSEDVTQDAFSKALLALRGTTTEIELKPWLYRIVRNTALNEIRDAPPATEELGEATPGGCSAAIEAERREEIGELMERLRALPEPQRAAIVMRELEGLGHEEIAAALGVSGGAARQAIYRARQSLRDGLGLLVPLPLLRLLFEHGAEAAAGAGAGATLGGMGAAGALKVGLATAVFAGSVGAGVAIQHDRGGRGPEPAEATATWAATDAGDLTSAGSDSSGSPGDSGESHGRGSSGSGGEGSESGDDDGGGGRGRGEDDGDRSGRGSAEHGFDDARGSGRSDGDNDLSAGSRSGRHASGSGGDSGSGSDGSGDGSGESSSGSGSSSSGDDGSDGDSDDS